MQTPYLFFLWFQCRVLSPLSLTEWACTVILRSWGCPGLILDHNIWRLFSLIPLKCVFILTCCVRIVPLLCFWFHWDAMLNAEIRCDTIVVSKCFLYLLRHTWFCLHMRWRKLIPKRSGAMITAVVTSNLFFFNKKKTKQGRKLPINFIEAVACIGFKERKHYLITIVYA